MKTLLKLSMFICLLLLWSCGPDASNQQSQNQTPPPTQDNPEGALTEWQLVNGMGPITEKIPLGPVDDAMAAEGAQLFETKCSMCHKLDERYVGPPLGEVTGRRSPEYIMNMILDPTAMVKYHPEVKKLLAQYYTPMTFQNVTQEDARKILEFFRKEGAMRLQK
jgi:mono/diheme cytochrome c family protein